MPEGGVTAVEVDRWLAERGQMRISRELATDLDLIPKRVHPFPGNRLRKVVDFTSSVDPETHSGPEIVADLASATVVTSEIGTGQPSFAWLDAERATRHRLVLDIDHRVKVVESSTPGHFHLYLDVPMAWERQAVPLLEALAHAGVVEPGYVGASKRRGYTAVRLPWIRKDSRRAVA